MADWLRIEAPRRSRYVVCHPLRLMYLRVNKAACSALGSSITAHWGPDEAVHMWHDDAVRYMGTYETVRMWRNPWRRMESAYRFMSAYVRAQYVREHNIPPVSLPFSDWVQEICSVEDHLRDRHLCSQHGFGQVGDHHFAWDFDGFARMFQLPAIGVVNPSEPKATEWTPEALEAFGADPAFSGDIYIWRSLTGE